MGNLTTLLGKIKKSTVKPTTQPKSTNATSSGIGGFKPDYQTLNHFEPRTSGPWIAKFGGKLASLNVVNGYAPITSIDLKFCTSIDDSLTVSPIGIQVNSIKGYQKPSEISATFFEVDDLSISNALKSEIESSIPYKQNRVFAYSKLQDFASDLIITLYKKDGTGVVGNYIYSVIPKSVPSFSNNQDFQLVTFSVDFLVVGFNQSS